MAYYLIFIYKIYAIYNNITITNNKGFYESCEVTLRNDTLTKK